MQYRLISFFLLAAWLLFPALMFGNKPLEIVEQQEKGVINWTLGIMQVTGIGNPPEKYYDKPHVSPIALRAAQVDAVRNLFKVVQTVRIDSSTTVGNFIIASDVIMSRVEGMVDNARIVKREYLSDGTVKVVMEMSLYGGFAQLVLPSEIKHVESIKPLAPASPATSPASSDSLETDSLPSAEIFSGLIVDARGLSVKPAMVPKILDENHQEVYGPAFVSREFVVQHGMAEYKKDLPAALVSPRAAGNPLTVKGLRAQGAVKTDIVISNSDAAKVRGASEHLGFLKRCRVIIVVDEKVIL
ncbi:MAG: hypothetical protein B6I22_03655 [Desulfobacteraceae bacterium 4572_123]|nr:MAG: hypothetical protein B6I22_03655 [Desulfobacteraceae bacterium 4572_123]